MQVPQSYRGHSADSGPADSGLMAAGHTGESHRLQHSAGLSPNQTLGQTSVQGCSHGATLVCDASTGWKLWDVMQVDVKGLGV